MKTKIHITIALILGLSPISFSINQIPTSLSTEVVKKELCKTWYIYKMIETNSNQLSIDKTRIYKGTTFSFFENNTFELKQKNEDISSLGTWNEISLENISIAHSNKEFQFKITQLSADSLTLKGFEKGKSDSEITIKFSTTESETISNKEEPIKESKQLLKSLRNTPEYVNALRNGTKKQSVKSADESRKIQEKYILDTWNFKTISVKTDKTNYDYTLPINFNFKKDYTFTVKENEITQHGTWKINNDKIFLTVNNVTTSFDITELNNNEFIMTKKDNKFVLSYRLRK